MNAHTSSKTRRQLGFTLVELLVAVAISLILTLAITMMLVRYEGGRRTLTSTNDSSIGGAYVAYLLDRTLRSAGSGFTQGGRVNLGCQLLVSRDATTVLPSSAAFPAPFASVPQTVRLAPVVAHAGAGADGSDVLMVQTGSSGLGEAPLRVLTGSATASELRVPATLGMRGGDLALVYQGGSDCLMQQLASGFAGGADQLMTFGGSYAVAELNGVRLQDMGAPSTATAWVAPLGHVSENPPQFQLLGVGANATLMTYDLLRLTGSNTPVAVADGVADLRVLYGVDTTGDGKIDSWQKPTGTTWGAAALLNGTPTAQANLTSIIALRVGILVRNSSPQRDPVAPASITLFKDLGSALEVERTLSDAEKQLTWRAIEQTVPLRNVLLM